MEEQRTKKSKQSATKRLTFRPLTPARWDDFERLFGERGACGGCWCMWWRLKRSDFEKKKGAGNKRAMKAIVQKGDVPGIIAYAGKEPVGWCAVAPRDDYGTLERSRILKPVHDQPAWSVVCFFVERAHRGTGVSVELLKAAVAHAKRHGARIVEGYPVEPKQDRMPDAFAWFGLASAFERAGFKEVARRSPTRPIMRILVKK
jgi:GNAT superfamily N-acetyltransferase